MTDLRESLEALRALASQPGDPIREPRHSHIGRYHSALAKAWESGALVPAPAVPDDVAAAYRDALQLATAIWERGYRKIAPDWKPLTDLLGVLSQIDNMTAGLLSRLDAHTAEQPAPDAVAEAWQAMDTAPTDGTKFAATNGRLTFTTYALKYYEKFPHEEGGPIYKTRWTAEDGSSVWPWNPTHWMPLPVAKGHQP